MLQHCLYNSLQVYKEDIQVNVLINATTQSLEQPASIQRKHTSKCIN